MSGGTSGAVRKERDLGVKITNDLKASAQCAYVCSRANRVLGMIRRTIVYKSPEVLTGLYKNLVRPHLEYCVSAWSPHYVKDRERLERVQHRFTRMVPGLKGLDCGERLERLKLMTLWRKKEIVQIWSRCSRCPKDCLPFHGTRSSVQTILKEQEEIRRSW